MTAYFIPPQRFLCVSGPYLVVLDLHNDRYSAFHGRAAAKLREQAVPVLIEPAAAELRADDDDARLSAGAVVAFAWACLKARWMLRFWRFERVVERVRKRRAQGAGELTPAELARVRGLVATAARVQPFLLTAKDACLLESLALSEFLASRHIFASWVFAVRMSPFGAHCWLQYGDVVLNDTVEGTRPFTPIMAV